ncbi:hypothetical protein [Ramlibacter montanisoli]|uniref:hypothetical protein n=1 Tax=Ramlibacter montanisoli TaxID=2732512 RepID=UPI00209BC5B1|nr:hypothetical protein [Ramlibacter montanisoli]
MTILRMVARVTLSFFSRVKFVVFVAELLPKRTMEAKVAAGLSPVWMYSWLVASLPMSGAPAVSTELESGSARRTTRMSVPARWLLTQAGTEAEAGALRPCTCSCEAASSVARSSAQGSGMAARAAAVGTPLSSPQ